MEEEEKKDQMPLWKLVIVAFAILGGFALVSYLSNDVLLKKEVENPATEQPINTDR